MSILSFFENRFYLFSVVYLFLCPVFAQEATTFYLDEANITVEEGIYTIPVKASGFSTLKGLHLSMFVTSTSELDLISLNDGLLTGLVENNNYVIYPNEFIIVWSTNGSPITLSDDATLFSLKIRSSTEMCMSFSFDIIELVDANNSVIEPFPIFTPTEICPDNNAVISVSGTIVYPKLDGTESPVPNIIVQSISENSTNDTTDAMGSYTIQQIQAGDNLIIRPKEEIDVSKNGITMLDVTLIRRHLLSQSPLSFPYQHIAADVDRSCKVSLRDIIIIQDYILSNRANFTDNINPFTPKEGDYWRFIAAAYTGFSGSNTCCMDCGSIQFDGINSSSSNQKFYAIKIGDVNFDAIP